jgi:hypothetical protein
VCNASVARFAASDLPIAAVNEVDSLLTASCSSIELQHYGFMNAYFPTEKSGPWAKECNRVRPPICSG